MTRLADLAWPDVEARAAASILAVPVGSTEQHGPHLPLSTDTDIAIALCDRLAMRRSDVLVAPALAYGSSGEHAGFAGTLSIGQGALRTLVVELVRSADAFAATLIVSAHGGNAVPLRDAEETLAREGRRVVVWSPPSGDPSDLHAGLAETSLQLALNPTLVNSARAEKGATKPIEDLWPELRANGVRAVSTNGVLGDPTDASSEAGRLLLEEWTNQLVSKLDSYS